MNDGGLFSVPLDAVASGLSCVEVVKEPFFSSKVLRLVRILSSFRLVFMASFLYSLTIMPAT